MLTRTMRIFPGALPRLAPMKLGQWLLFNLRKSVQSQRDLNNLRLMSDHQLKDLGIGRGEIPGVMDSPGPGRWERY